MQAQSVRVGEGFGVWEHMCVHGLLGAYRSRT